MPRQIRVEYPGANYHVISHGDRKGAIYLDNIDRQDFLKTLAETCQKTDFEVHAHWRTSRTGIEAGTPRRGVHLVLHGIWRSSRTGRDACGWTSCSESREASPTQSNDAKNLSGGRRRRGRRRRTEQSCGRRDLVGRRCRAAQIGGQGRSKVEAGATGLVFGWAGVKGAVVGWDQGRVGGHQSGELRSEFDRDKAAGIILEELGQLGWNKSDLTRRAKGDPAKLALAARLRRETTLTIREIAERPRTGSWKSLSDKLYQWKKAQ